MLAQMLLHYPPCPELQEASDHSIRLLPDNYQAWLLSATLLQHKRGPDAALGWLQSVAAQNPQLVAIRLARASLTARRNPGDAISQFEAVAQEHPTDTRTQMLLAELHKAHGNLAAAAECFEQALRVQPESAQYWGMLAETRLAQGQWQKAVSSASAAIKLDRKQWAAWEIRGDAQQKACAWDEALSDYLTLANQQQDNLRVLNKIGVCLVRRERLDEAREYFDRVLQLDPDFADAKVNKGFLQAKLGRLDKAVAQISDAVANGKLDAKSRHAAVTALAVLHEQQRLGPHIAKALEESSVDHLHRALTHTPAELSQTDPGSLQKLAELADMCRAYAFATGLTDTTAGDNRLAFIEACAHCKLDRESVVALAKDADIATGPTASAGDTQVEEVFRVWQAILGRRGADIGDLSRTEGEAWLRYWHARLLQGTPEAQPGQYKAIQNTIGRETPPPPETVPGAYRAVLADLRTSVPAGLPRGVFMLLALNLVHGFADGNGRLSRFLLAWELEAAGLPAISIPAELRDEYATALVRALWRQDLEALTGVLEAALSHGEDLLREVGH